MPAPAREATDAARYTCPTAARLGAAGPARPLCAAHKARPLVALTFCRSYLGMFHLTPQEVLRALHSHLGAHVASETDAALQVLTGLARAHTVGLMKYAAFLTNILDYLDGYSDAQTHQVRSWRWPSWEDCCRLWAADASCLRGIPCRDSRAHGPDGG
jgi:hypothetical protein